MCFTYWVHNLPYSERWPNPFFLTPNCPRCSGFWPLFVCRTGCQLCALLSLSPSPNGSTQLGCAATAAATLAVSVLSLSHASPPAGWWAVQGVLTCADLVLAAGTTAGSGSNWHDLSKAFVELLAHEKMVLYSIYLGCCHYRCISINGHTPSSS